MTGLRVRPALLLTALLVCSASRLFCQSPNITSLSPSSITAGASSFTLTVNGSGFGSSAVVRWNGASLTTTFVNGTQLTAAIPATLVTTAGSATVTVVSGSVTSNGSSFTINPPPTITSLAPISATAGGPAFTLTVNGTNFVTGAVVRWNATPLTTNLVSATQLTATVPATLISSAGSATITVLSGSATTSGLPFTINAPPPTITSIDPTSATAGGSAFTLTVNGTNFVTGAMVRWNTTALMTTLASASQLTATVPAPLTASAGSATVTVLSAGVTTSGLPFTINPPPPTIASLSPSSATAGGAAFTLTVGGNNFVTGAVVQWNGTALTTTFGSATQLTAAVPASLIAAAGNVSVTVLSGGTTTSALSFTVNPAPAIASLNPGSATAGGPAFTLTVSGSSFAQGTAVVRWNGSALPTTFVNAGSLTASVSANLIATQADATVSVISGGVASNGVAFAINAPPAIGSLSPSSATAGGPAFTLTVSGSGFLQDAVIRWNGSPLPTTVQSGTQLAAQVSASLIASSGTAAITVISGGVTSNTAQFTIGAGPAITTLGPSSATAGGAAFTLTVTGSNFASGAVIQWNTSALTTNFVSATQLTATISPDRIANPGTVNVKVNSSGVDSNTVTFVILNGPTINTISPSITTAGGPDLTLTVDGGGFTTASVVTWNGSASPTSFVNPNRLTASVAAKLIASPGTADVTVASGGVTFQPAKLFTIKAGPAIRSLNPSAATAGGPAFTLTINGSGFGADTVTQWNGTALTTTVVGENQLTAAVPAELTASVGSIPIMVLSGGVTSNSVAFDVANGPTLSSLNPGTAIAGGGQFTLSVNGAGFTAGTTVQWNGTSLATTFVNVNQVTAPVPASLIATAGTAQITALTNGVSSNALSLVVSVGITSLSPPSGSSSGQPFTLTVNGSGFNSGSVVEWNGIPLETTFGSSTQLTAGVPGNLSQNPGAAQISVLSNGVTSMPIAFALVYPLSAISLSGLTPTPTPTQPLNLNVQLANAAPTDLQGKLALSFVPNAAGIPSTYMDPALQFASGGTTTNFTITAGTTTPAAPIPAIQQGTVAGQIVVTLTSLSASLSTGALNVLPGLPVTTSVAVLPIAPVIESCSVGTIANGAFSVQLDAYSTPRDLASASYIFMAAPGAQITVTTANGGQVTGTTQISVPVTPQLSAWFSGSMSQPNGSVFSLQAPFTLSGNASALQAVNVILTNSIGPSAQFACTR